MMRCGTQGAYLLLVGKGRVLTWKKVVIRDRALVFFNNQQNVQNKDLMFIWKGFQKMENGLVPI